MTTTNILLTVVHGEDAGGEEVLHCLHTHPKEFTLLPLVSEEGVGHALVAAGVPRWHVGHYLEGRRGAEDVGL